MQITHKITTSYHLRIFTTSSLSEVGKLLIRWSEDHNIPPTDLQARLESTKSNSVAFVDNRALFDDESAPTAASVAHMRGYMMSDENLKRFATRHPGLTEVELSRIKQARDRDVEQFRSHLRHLIEHESEPYIFLNAVCLLLQGKGVHDVFATIAQQKSLSKSDKFIRSGRLKSEANTPPGFNPAPATLVWLAEELQLAQHPSIKAHFDAIFDKAERPLPTVHTETITRVRTRDEARVNDDQQAVAGFFVLLHELPKTITSTLKIRSAFGESKYYQKSVPSVADLNVLLENPIVRDTGDALKAAHKLALQAQARLISEGANLFPPTALKKGA